ncbi:hypothetical protein LTR50_002844 [Elasticomyces elasticus]|nr:hypothetical protein LTR50_002844 [Elasticomyces elasticus]
MEVIYNDLPSSLKTVDFVLGPVILFLYALVSCVILLSGLLSNYKTTKALRTATVLFYLCGLVAMDAELITINLKVATSTAPNKNKLTIRNELGFWVVIFVAVLAILLALVLLSLMLAVLLGRMLMRRLCSSSEPSKNGKHFTRKDVVTAKVMPIVGSVLFTLIHLCTVTLLSGFALAHPFALFVIQDPYGPLLAWLILIISTMTESLLIAHGVFTANKTTFAKLIASPNASDAMAKCFRKVVPPCLRRREKQEAAMNRDVELALLPGRD